MRIRTISKVLFTVAILSLCEIGIANSSVMDFELPKLDGTAFVRLNDYAGRAVLLNFWGSECPPCIAEMPWLFSQALRYPEIQFIGITVDKRASATRYLARMQPTYPQLIAPSQPAELMRRFGNKSGALPYTVIVNIKHEICAEHKGAIDDQWFIQSFAVCNLGLLKSSSELK
jgi:thiol-disulfide isomerase/thioredoxin